MSFEATSTTTRAAGRRSIREAGTHDVLDEREIPTNSIFWSRKSWDYGTTLHISSRVRKTDNIDGLTPATPTMP